MLRILLVPGRALGTVLALLVAGCGGSSSPGPVPAPDDSGVQPADAASSDGARVDSGCDWGYSCNGGKCICTGGKLDNKSCADAPTCRKVCATGC